MREQMDGGECGQVTTQECVQCPSRTQPSDSIGEQIMQVSAFFQEVITEECRILESVHYELRTPTPALGFKSLRSSSSCGASSASSVFRSLRARSSRAVLSGVLASGAQDIADVYVPKRPFSLEARPSCTGSSAWFLLCAFWICPQVAGARLKQCCGGSFCFFWRVPPHTFPILCLILSSLSVARLFFFFRLRPVT